MGLVEPLLSQGWELALKLHPSWYLWDLHRHSCRHCRDAFALALSAQDCCPKGQGALVALALSLAS